MVSRIFEHHRGPFGYHRDMKDVLPRGSAAEENAAHAAPISAAELAAQLSRQLALTQAITTSLGEGVYVLDRMGRVTFMNPAAEQLLGWTEMELRGRDMHQAIHFQRADGTPFPEEECPLVGVVRSGETVGEDDDVFTRKDGSLLPVAYTSSPMLLDGEVVGAVLAFRDISATKEWERMRDGFLSSAAHDLKTPLTSIRGYAQLARRRTARLGDPEAAPVAAQLEQIEDAATRMLGLINELVDVSRLHMGAALTLEPEPTDLVALARGVVAQQEGSAGNARIAVEATLPDLPANVDAARIERVLDNLLSNAIKYSPKDGAITVRIARDDGPAGPEAVIGVSDHGVGIPADDLPHIFERFRRAGNVVGHIRGTGVGLASARQIVEQHGGIITVESQEGAGSTFTVRLPLDTADLAG